MYTTFQVLVMYCCWYIVCVTGDPVMYYSPFEYRSVPADIRANKLSVLNSNISPHPNHVTRQQIIQTSGMQSQPVPTAEKLQTKNSDLSFQEFYNVMNELSKDENQISHSSYRADAPEKEEKPTPDTYPRHNFDSWTPQPFHEPSTGFVSSTSIEEQSSNVLPKFNLLEPLTTKMSTKMSGLIGFILTLLGSGKDNNLLMKGFKQIVIEGILRPLMVAKGGIKALINKITIPLISLLLINVEVLITVWWLWDDCPQPLQPLNEPSLSNFKDFNTTFR